MRWSTCPAVWAALALGLGIEAGFRTGETSLAALFFLMILGLALRRNVGLALALFAVGWMLGELAGPPGQEPPAELDLNRPVTARLQVEGPWWPGEDGWASRCRSRWLRQDGVVEAGPKEIWIWLPGPEEEPPPPGTELLAQGLLRRRQALRNVPVVAEGPWRLRVKSRSLIAVVAEPGPLYRLSARLRSPVKEALARLPVAGHGSRAWAQALLLGETFALDQRTQQGLRRLGCGHLLAVSGLHVALLEAVALLLTAWAPLPLQRLAMASAGLLYLFLVGPRPSILRAAAMATLALLALTARRPPVAANLLGLFTLVALGLEPGLIRDLALQLSLGATAGLIALAPALGRRWTALPAAGRYPLTATAAAQVCTLPWSLSRFHVFLPWATVANLLLVPLAGLLLGSLVLWVLLALVFAAVGLPDLALFLVPVVELLAAPLTWVSRLPPMPGMVLPFTLVPWKAALLAGLAAAALLWPRRLGAPLLVTAALLFLLRTPRSGAEMILFDVGQGESLLLRDGERAILVDGGGWPAGDFAARVLIPALAGVGQRSLEAVVLTHPDQDHCGGLADLAGWLSIPELWAPRLWRDAPCVQEILATGTVWRPLDAGQELDLGAWHFLVLHPQGEDPPRRHNDGSLVLVAEAHGQRLLLTGDIGREVEQRLLEKTSSALDSDVLKVAHHGSASSSESGFLARASPRLALISAGRGNSYGHPHPKVLARLRRQRVPLLRTDLHGQVVLRFEADGVKIAPQP